MRESVLLFVLLTLAVVGCGGTQPAPGADATPSPAVADSARASVAASTPAPSVSAAPLISARDSGDEASCTDELLPFRYPPVELDAIEYITPLGLMSDSHVTPVDHQYYQNFADPEREIAVYSPAAGTITDIQRMTQTLSDRSAMAIDDFRIVIDHGCGISSIYIHVGELVPSIAAVAPAPGEHAAVSHEVEAGEQLGSYRQNVDYNVVDESVTLPGLLVPEHYAREPWKIHTPDPFEYFTDEIRDLMLAKSLRNGDPAGGKIDYDIAGRLVGNWFREGTNGYAGSDPSRYWGGHLAVAYDHIDPSHVIVSIGTFDGAAAQFAVRGNGPDPAEVSATTGPVLYELVMFDYWVGEQRWDRRTLAKGIEARNYGAQVRGVVLFEVLASGKLRMETFPGETAASVDGFTTGALIYER